jgi:hypothetical protein
MTHTALLVVEQSAQFSKVPPMDITPIEPKVTPKSTVPGLTATSAALLGGKWYVRGLIGTTSTRALEQTEALVHKWNRRLYMQVTLDGELVAMWLT